MIGPEVRLITISREHAAGAADLARALAEGLGWESWDKQIVEAVAGVAHLPPADAAQVDEHGVGWRQRLRPHAPHRVYLAALEEVVTTLAERGDAVILGRGASVLLRGRPDVLHLRLVAPLASRAAREQRQVPSLSLDRAADQCRAIDAERARFLRFWFGADVHQLTAYDLVINADRIRTPVAVDAVRALVRHRPPEWTGAAAGRLIVTLTAQFGSGEREFAAALAGRIGLAVADREVISRAAGLLGISDAQLSGLDESAPPWWQRRPAFEAMRRVMTELGAKGGFLIIGRGGSEFLCDRASTLRLRLIAPPAARVSRVMAHRWWAEGPAREAIEASDAHRRAFYRRYFGIDWADPTRFDLTLNTGRLGAAAVDLALAAAATQGAVDRAGA